VAQFEGCGHRQVGSPHHKVKTLTWNIPRIPLIPRDRFFAPFCGEFPSFGAYSSYERELADLSGFGIPGRNQRKSLEGPKINKAKNPAPFPVHFQLNSFGINKTS